MTTDKLASRNESPSLDAEPVLSSGRVQLLLGDCLSRPEEGGAVVVEGVRCDYAFDRAKLDERRTELLAMLAELPDQFATSSGGGWTFLNLCVDRHGRQWTDLHQVQEWLCCLAIGAGVGRWVLPRHMWEALPGGMPYVQFEGASA